MSGVHFDFTSPESPTLASHLTRPSPQPLFDKSFKPMDIKAESRLENAEVNFVLTGEGYTLVNIMKQYLYKMREVEFVGVRQHHKLDECIHLRIKLKKQVIEQTDIPAEQLIFGCLRKAARQAIEQCVQLRNTIPDVQPRIVIFEDSSSSVPDNQPFSVNPFKTLFDPSDLTF